MIVTHVSVFLDVSSSAVGNMAVLVKRQVDLDVNSKSYPLLENDSTNTGSQHGGCWLPTGVLTDMLTGQYTM